jgi:uncharacterized membrane protein (UPF0127 family)
VVCVRAPLFLWLAAVIVTAGCGVPGGPVAEGRGRPTPILEAPLGRGLGTITLRKADGSTRQLRVEVADDESSRGRGLMFRQSLPEDAGMIFIFPADGDSPFWMQNTPLPLSIAFIAADGRIVDIKDMQPLSTELVRPAAIYRTALEVNQGYFGRAGVRVGDRAELRRD